MTLGANTEMVYTSRVWTVRGKSRNVIRSSLALWSLQHICYTDYKKNLDPSTNLWPPSACHCWECHRQNVGEILHEKIEEGGKNRWTSRSECFTAINITFQHSVWPTTGLTISENIRCFRVREIELKTRRDKTCLSIILKYCFRLYVFVLFTFIKITVNIDSCLKTMTIGN